MSITSIFKFKTNNTLQTWYINLIFLHLKNSHSCIIPPNNLTTTMFLRNFRWQQFRLRRPQVLELEQASGLGLGDRPVSTSLSAAASPACRSPRRHARLSAGRPQRLSAEAASTAALRSSRQHEGAHRSPCRARRQTVSDDDVLLRQLSRSSGRVRRVQRFWAARFCRYRGWEMGGLGCKGYKKGSLKNGKFKYLSQVDSFS